MTKNIVLFLTDQWRWDTLNDPDNPAKLPHLQAFKAEATNFTNAFTPVPLCTPARASLFTGLLPHQHGTMDNVAGTSFYPFGKLHPSRVTYLERLIADGFDLSFIGKWHLGEGTLVDRGIPDICMSDGDDGQLGSHNPDLTLAEPSLPPYYTSVTKGEPLDGVRVDEALARLKRLSKSDKPFCLVISLHGPHFPHVVPKEYVDLYDDLPADFMPDNFCPQFSEQGKPAAQGAYYWPCQNTKSLTQQDWRRTAQHYWGFCSYLDAQFGRVRQAMSDLGLDDNSVLAFSADHGEMLGAHGWFDKGPFFYDEIMRIPMMIRDPSRKTGNTAENFVSFRDIFPTLIASADAGHVLKPDEAARSFWDSCADHITYGYDAYQGRQFKFRGIRNDRYKYAWSPHDLEELYDLDSDPHERVNLADDVGYAALKDGLRVQLFDWMEDESDYLLAGTHDLPVGSYVDGRDRTEQHSHVPV